jgi:hypothetical protein
MFGFARIIVQTDAIGVRFEQVGQRQKFNAVMDRFNRSFPLKEWDSSRRLWLLPNGDLNDVVSFCRQTFGMAGYQIERETITA